MTFPVASLAKVAIIRMGSPAPQGAEYFSDDGQPFVRVQDVGRCGRTLSLTETKDRINQHAIARLRPALAKKGTIVFPKSGAAISTNSRAILGVDAYVVSHLAMVEPRQALMDTEWLYYYLCTVDMGKLSRTTSLPSLRLSELSELEVPVPSIDEQRCIVARIKACMERVNEIDVLRKEESEIRGTLMRAVRRESLGISSVLPTGWIERRLDNLAEVIYGISEAISANRDPSIGPPIVRMANISLDGHLDLSDLRYCAIPKGKEEHFALRRGDLLLNWRSGSSSHVGKTALFDTDGLFTCASFILRIRVKTQEANNRYLRHVLNFMRAEGVFSDSSRMQINHKLNATEFSAFPVRIPPTLAEQQDIADVLDSAESIYQRHIRVSDQRAIEVIALRAAILRKAFAGEL